MFHIINDIKIGVSRIIMVVMVVVIIIIKIIHPKKLLMS